MSTSTLFDLPLGQNVRTRLAELVADGCTLSSTTDRGTVEERDPCRLPAICSGSCVACSAKPRRVERQRTRVAAVKRGRVVWETWV